MEIYINEKSFEEQFADRRDIQVALSAFLSILNTIKDLQLECKLYNQQDMIYIYKAFRGEDLITTINRLGDKFFTQAAIDILYNKLQTVDWRNEQLHSSDDIFMCDDDIVTETSMAELAERTLQNRLIVASLINFPKSKYTNRSSLCIIKDELHTCDLRCIEEKQEMLTWLNEILDFQDIHYNYESNIPPRAHETVLKDITRFEKTSYINSGQSVYKEIGIKRFWYIDNFHFGLSAHLEVFDAYGDHVGEADLSGVIDDTKRDPNKYIDM